jgi:hypothetical protein
MMVTVRLYNTPASKKLKIEPRCTGFRLAAENRVAEASSRKQPALAN